VNGHTPDISGNATVVGAAATTLIVWGLSLAGVVMDGEVATALTTLIAVGFGLIRGDNSTNRRSGDPSSG